MAAELRALQLLDDGFQALDFSVAMFDRADNIANQAMPNAVSVGRLLRSSYIFNFTRTR